MPAVSRRKWLVGIVSIVVVAVVVASVLVYKISGRAWVAEPSYTFDPCSILSSDDLSPLLETPVSEDQKVVPVGHTLTDWGRTVADRCEYDNLSGVGDELVAMEIGKKRASAEKYQQDAEEPVDIGDGSTFSVSSGRATMSVTVNDVDFVLTAVGDQARPVYFKGPFRKIAQSVIAKLPKEYKTPGKMARQGCDSMPAEQVESALGGELVFSRSYENRTHDTWECSFGSNRGKVISLSLDLKESPGEVERFQKVYDEVRPEKYPHLYWKDVFTLAYATTDPASITMVSWSDTVSPGVDIGLRSDFSESEVPVSVINLVLELIDTRLQS